MSLENSRFKNKCAARGHSVGIIRLSGSDPKSALGQTTAESKLADRECFYKTAPNTRKRSIFKEQKASIDHTKHSIVLHLLSIVLCMRQHIGRRERYGRFGLNSWNAANLVAAVLRVFSPSFPASGKYCFSITT